VSPFAYADYTCDLCREGVQTSCPNGGLLSAAQADLIRVPQAQGTLVRLPVGEESVFLPSLLTLADVYGTGYHAALTAGVNARTTVTVVGDGAVGLLSVLSARRMGAEQIILMGRHKDRTDLGREYGAGEVVAERGPEAVERVRELTRGEGTHTVIEAVGHLDAYETALGVVRAGGTEGHYPRSPGGAANAAPRSLGSRTRDAADPLVTSERYSRSPSLGPRAPPGPRTR
jgi:threonine dehydrogenase-like Zn-dependent dehydrogenase